MKARILSASDDSTIQEWIDRDPEHKGKIRAPFFTQPSNGQLAYAWEDENGKTLFYVLVENVARIHIQFNPDLNRAENARGLNKGYEWLIDGLRDRGYKEMIFESTYAPLIRFCKRVFGFKKSENDFSRGL